MSRLMMGALVFLSSALTMLASGGARADTMTCVDGGSGYCSLGSTGNYGSVTITGLGTSTADITFNLSVGTIADPADGSVVFDITGATSGSILSGSGWGPVVVNGSQQIDAGEPGGSSFGVFPDGASCNNFNGCGSSVEIQVKGTDLTLASIGGYFAAIDTQNTVCTESYYGYCFQYNTENGAVAQALSATPLPGALPLFGTVIGAGFLGFRRRRKALAGAAA